MPGGVIVECESLSLSRDIPWGIKQIISPIVDRIARQSMRRTLDNLAKAHPAPAAAERPGSPEGLRYSAWAALKGCATAPGQP